MNPTILEELKRILGNQSVLDSYEDRLTYSYDGTPLFQRLPEAVLIPHTVEQISKVLALANEERFAVVPRGSGSGLSGGSIPVENSVVLLMNTWNRILEIDEKNLTAWVEPGLITGKLHQSVEDRGLFYPPDPGSSSVCTIGGNVAENAGGLRGLKYGVTKNYVLGLEVVLPGGQVFLTGGKSMKDVAGYSLKDVLIGSEGTLGVFTKILVKLIPRPETSLTMIAFFDSLGDMAETVADIVASRITPAALEFLDNTTIRCVDEYANLGLPTTFEALLLVEVDGRPAVVKDDADTILSICKRHGAKSLTVAKDEQEAMRLRAARKSAFSALARVRPTTILEDATVPRSELPVMLERIRDIAAKYNLLFGNFGHAGDGNLHPTCLADERDDDEIDRAHKGFAEMFDAALQLGGTITGEHGIGLAKREFFENHAPSAALEVMRLLKSVLDPNMVLNPGKIISFSPRCEGPMPRTKAQLEKFLEQGAFL
jgi:glycolate oxidase